MLRHLCIDFRSISSSLPLPFSFPATHPHPLLSTHLFSPSSLLTHPLLPPPPSCKVPVSSPAEVEQIFDAISYSKGACVIRMLHGWIGDEVGVANWFCVSEHMPCCCGNFLCCFKHLVSLQLVRLFARE